jgi:hypothetical protein
MHGGTSRREKIGHDRHGRHGKEGPGEGLAEGPTEGGGEGGKEEEVAASERKWHGVPPRVSYAQCHDQE